MRARPGQSDRGDPGLTVERVAGALGLPLIPDGAALGGQGRTFAARMAGRAVIVKWGLDPDLPEKIPYVAAQVAPLARRGCRIPGIIAHGHMGSGGYAWVQEQLPGTTARRLDDALLAELTSLIRRLADAPRGQHRNDMAFWVPAVVFDDLAGWWRQAAAAGPRASAFCARLRAWISDERPAPRHDYVHSDLNLGNVMVADGRLVGLVDAEGVGVGDRGIDIARLAFDWFRLSRSGVTGQATDGLAVLLGLSDEICSPAGWRTAVGYELAGRLGWRSEHDVRFSPRYTPEHLLPVAEDFLSQVAPRLGPGAARAPPALRGKRDSHGGAGTLDLVIGRVPGSSVRFPSAASGDRASERRLSSDHPARWPARSTLR